MLPSAADRRPERRSDDGQMIFEASSAAREPGSDLGFRGAPLRDRTVDLLLTIHTSLGSLPGKHFPQAASKRRSGSCLGLRRLRSLRPSRLQPSSSWHGSMPRVCSVRPRLVCHSSLASGAACRPATSTPTVKGRSGDLSYPARPGPEDHAEQAFPHRQEQFEPVPLSAPHMKATGSSLESCRAQDHTAEHVEVQSQAAWPPERGR